MAVTIAARCRRQAGFGPGAFRPHGPQRLLAAGVVFLPGAPGVERMSGSGHRCGGATTTGPMAMAPFWGRPQMKRSDSRVLQEPAS